MTKQQKKWIKWSKRRNFFNKWRDAFGFSPLCTCPEGDMCNCEDPERGKFSMSCPIHNDLPYEDACCPLHGGK